MLVGAMTTFVATEPALPGAADAEMHSFDGPTNTVGRISARPAGRPRTAVHRTEAFPAAVSGRPPVIDGDTVGSMYDLYGTV